METGATPVLRKLAAPHVCCGTTRILPFRPGKKFVNIYGSCLSEMSN